MHKQIIGGCAVLVALFGLSCTADAAAPQVNNAEVSTGGITKVAAFVRGGFGFRGGFGPRFRGGVVVAPTIGFGFYDPWWAYPYPYPYYAPPPVVVETAPAPGYAPPADGAPLGQNWYYCNNPQGYYPYVRTCNGPWQAVPAAPNNGPQR